MRKAKRRQKKAVAALKHAALVAEKAPEELEEEPVEEEEDEEEEEEEEDDPLPDWCPSVRVSFTSRSTKLQEQIQQEASGDGDNGGAGHRYQVVVLPEAEGVSARRRTLITLPSGKLLACLSSVLVRYSSVLEKQAARLLSCVVVVDYTPDDWNDEDVVEFMSLLHQDNVAVNTVQQAALKPRWAALFVGFRVKQHIELCENTVQTKLLARNEANPDSALAWVGVYRLFKTSDEWKEACVQFLVHLGQACFKQCFAAQRRQILLQMFSVQGVFALAFARWEVELKTSRQRQSLRTWKPAAAVRDPRSTGTIATEGQSFGPSLVGQRVRVAWAGGKWYPGTVTQYNPADNSHFVQYDDGDQYWYDMKAKTFELGGRTYIGVNQSSQQAQSQTQQGKHDEFGVVTMFDPKLPKCMQLRVAITDKFAVVCDYDIIETMSHFVRDAVVDENGRDGITELACPFASSFPQREVVEFFELLHSRDPLPQVWKMSWVHLADYLHVERWFTHSAEWLWSNMSHEHFAAWVAATRLQSMQRRKPGRALPTATNEDVVNLMLSLPIPTLRSIVSGDVKRFISVLGVDVLCDVLHRR